MVYYGKNPVVIGNGVVEIIVQIRPQAIDDELPVNVGVRHFRDKAFHPLDRPDSVTKRQQQIVGINDRLLYHRPTLLIIAHMIPPAVSRPRVNFLYIKNLVLIVFKLPNLSMTNVCFSGDK